MFAFCSYDLAVGTEGVQDRHMVSALVSKFPPGVRDGVAVFADVDEEFGGRREDSDDVEDFRCAMVAFRGYDGASILWFKGK